MKLYIQLNFPGNCAKAFTYYEQHLGGKITAMMRQSQAPGASPKADGVDPVIHARMELEDSVLIANDVPPDRLKPMRSAYLYLSVDSEEDAERIYEALTLGGEAYMPLQETFFATRFSQLRDQFGTLWTLLHQRPTP